MLSPQQCLRAQASRVSISVFLVVCPVVVPESLSTGPAGFPEQGRFCSSGPWALRRVLRVPPGRGH